MGPKKDGKKDGKKGKGKGKKKKDDGPKEPTPKELNLKITNLTIEKTKEEQDRNYMQLERDKIAAFWEITKKENENLKADVRNRERDLERMEEQQQVEMKVYNQKMKHLLFEQQHTVAGIKADHEMALKVQRDLAAKREQEHLTDKRSLKEKNKELEVSYDETIRQFKLDHAKEITKMRQEFEVSSKELVQKCDKQMRILREEADLRRKQEIAEIEERKNVHINDLMRKHEEAFTEIKCYYNDITHNNLDLIKTLKEDVTDMKKKEAANEKLMYEIAQENKRLTEPLAKALREVETLRKQLVDHEKDKKQLHQTRVQLLDTIKQAKNLEWDMAVLREKFDQMTTERDDLHAKFENSIFEVQQKCGLKSMLLQRKVQVLGEKLEVKEAQLTEALVKAKLEPGMLEDIENVLEAKNSQIRSLLYDIGKVTKAHNDVVKAFEAKLAEYGVPLEEMGLPHYITSVLP